MNTLIFHPKQLCVFYLEQLHVSVTTDHQAINTA